VDLLYLSGTLALEHEVKVLDAIARRLNQGETKELIRRFNPEAIVALVSAPSFAEDDGFLAQLKETLPSVILIGTGDIYREHPEETFTRQPYLNASLVDFSTDDILKYLRNPKGNQIDNMIYRNGKGLIAGQETHAKGQFRIPMPLWSEFPPGLYSMPFVKQSPFATVLSDFGCPYLCSFCPMSTINFKLRPIDDVLDEIKELWSLGYREIHFRDQTFAVDKKRTLDLCQRITGEIPGLTWSCFSRVDVIDEDRVQAMAEAGCHTIIFGIEFDKDLLLKNMKKFVNKKQIVTAIELCRTYKVRSAGTFIVGLPDQSSEDFLKTGELAVRLGLDFASFNLAMPRMGTHWRQELIEHNQVDSEEWHSDTQMGSAAWKAPKVNQYEARQLLRRIERRFYLRPQYLGRTVRRIRSWPELKTLVSNGLGILRKGN
jgi:anaerobic magnesium-protoporphyrin IX monomethyl ester cyclase